MLRQKPSYDEFARHRLYRNHRKEVKRIRSHIDNKPVPVLTESGYALSKMQNDAWTFQQLNHINNFLLNKLSTINRRSFASCYRRAPRHEIDRSRISFHNLKQDTIERQNYSLGCKLLKVKSSLNTRRGLEAYREEMRSERTFKVPAETLRKYSSIVLPQEAGMLRELLRPKIFLDLQLQNSHRLGRIVIQLFTEACPPLVLEFVRMCVELSRKAFTFIRIFSTLWVEGELKFNSPALRGPDFEYDMHVVDHGHGPGVLSFAKCYLEGFKNGLINYSISFRPLGVLNGERVAFGLVTQGLRTLDCLQVYGTRNGKTTKEITVGRCGMSN